MWIRSPITPVEHARTSPGSRARASASASVAASASASPSGPVPALAWPLFTMTARAEPSARRSRVSSTGHAANAFVVNSPAAVAGAFARSRARSGLPEGFSPAVTPEVKAAAEAVREAIIAGTTHPFAGPVKDQKGEVKIAEGAVASDEMLSKMDWYVEGVQA